jgi:hypothetical protein
MIGILPRAQTIHLFRFKYKVEQTTVPKGLHEKNESKKA